MKKYLAIIDLQNDFIDGTLGVGLKDFIPAWKNIEKEISKNKNLILTADCHPEDHCSFKGNKDKDGKEGIWPKHCIKGTNGYKFYKELDNYLKKDKVINKVIINKGKDKSKEEYGVDLLKGLKDKEAEIYITGLCYDYCVSECAKMTAEANPKSKIIILKNCSVAIDKNKKMDFSNIPIISICSV